MSSLASHQGENLLRQLEPAGGQRPVAIQELVETADDARGTVDESASGLPFQHLVDQAVAGELTTGRSISMAAGIELAANDLERISGAADRAEATGGKRAAVFLGRHLYLLDIATRQITESVGFGADDQSAESAGAIGVRLDSPAWRFLSDAGSASADAAGEGAEHAAQIAEPMADLSSRLMRQQTAKLTLAMDNRPVDGERIITGIDTAIILDGDPDGEGRAGNSALQMFAHLRGPVAEGGTPGSVEVMRVSG